jgi:hypothetical protein
MNMMSISHGLTLTPAQTAWIARVFDAKAVAKGAVVRRSIASIDREIGRDVFEQEVKQRGFHLIACGDQFIVICNTGRLQIIA